MRGSSYCRLLFAALFAASAGLRAGEADPLAGIPEVVAEVNAQKITRSELVRELVGASAAEGIDRVVRRKLIEQAAKAAGITVSDNDIDLEFNIDKRDLMEELIKLPWGDKNEKQFPIEDIIRARFRMSVDEYKKNVIRQKLLIERCVAKDYQPTEEQLRAVFNNPANYEFFQPPVKYRASHILITPLDPRDLMRGSSYQAAATPNRNMRQRRIDLYRNHNVNIEGVGTDDIDPAWKKSRDKAEKLLADINAGRVTWEQALRDNTQDPHDLPWKDPKTGQMRPPWRQMVKPPKPPGDVGYFHANGPLVKEFYEAVKGHKKDDIVGPVLTEYGYHLIKVTEVEQAPELKFEECRQRVERLSLAKYIEVRSTVWISSLVDAADLKTRAASFWPPRPSAGVALDPAGNLPEAAAEADPIVGTVNGEPIRRSEIWLDLIQAEGDEALKRLMNREIVLTMLKELGIERMEWQCAHPYLRGQAPAIAPIKSAQVEGKVLPMDLAVDFQLNEDRLQCDKDNVERAAKKLPELSFKDYLFEKFGQTEKEYRRAIEASLILKEAIRKRVSLDVKSLQLYFAFNREAYLNPDSYEISHILVVPEGGMKGASQMALMKALDTAEGVRKMYANAPENWNQLVNLFSNDTAENKARGGSLGACYADDRKENIPEIGPVLHRAIVDQRLQPQPGLASAPIRTSRGFHVVKIDSLRKGRMPEFDEVRDRIEIDYLNERAKMYTDVWLRSLKRALKKQAAVKVYLYPEAEEPDFEDGLPPDGPLPLPKD